MSEQSSPPPAASKPWYLKWWVWLIAALLVVGGISALVNPSSTSTAPGAAQPTQATTDEPSASPTPPPTGEVIYPHNDAINAFVLAFNDAHPDQALAAGDLTVYNHHGTDHEDQVTTTIDGAEVVISEDAFSRGLYGISVVWDNPTPGTANGNLAVFRTLVKVVAPALPDAEIDARWREILDHPTNRPEWGDGTEVVPGPTAVNNAPGTFAYVKLYG